MIKKLKEVMLSKMLYIAQAHLLPGMSLGKWEEIMKGRKELEKMKLAELDEVIKEIACHLLN